MSTPYLGVLLIVLSHIWHGIGVPMTIVLAGIVSIPESLYEASTLDGAGNVKQFFKITLPLLTPTLSRVLMLNLVAGAMAFDYTFSIRNALVGTKYDTLSSFMYREIMKASTQNIGLPSAIGFILSVVVFILFIIQFIVTRKVEQKIQ